MELTSEYMNSVLEKHKHKQTHKKPNITFTTGDLAYNIKQFNKRMGTDFNNPSTEEAKAASSAIADMYNSTADVEATISGDNNNATVAAEGTGEGADGLSEAKRKIKRYYIRPQNLWAGNKTELLKTLIALGNQNCSVYTLKNLDDNTDVSKLSSKDIIYYYDDGILYDKNKVKIMDYDLYIKKEEDRKKFSGGVAAVSPAVVADEYEDRLTGLAATDQKNAIESLIPESIDPFKLNFDSYNAFGEKLVENAAVESTCCICGEPLDGYGNNPAPYKSSGRCCDACNIKFVIPARLEQWREE